MSSTALRERITKSLLDEIDEVRFTSVTMMDRAEAALASRDDLANYADEAPVRGRRRPKLIVTKARSDRACP